MSVVFYNGSPLIVPGGLALDLDCCCDEGQVCGFYCNEDELLPNTLYCDIGGPFSCDFTAFGVGVPCLYSVGGVYALTRVATATPSFLPVGTNCFWRYTAVVCTSGSGNGTLIIEFALVSTSGKSYFRWRITKGALTHQSPQYECTQPSPDCLDGLNAGLTMTITSGSAGSICPNVPPDPPGTVPNPAFPSTVPIYV